MLSDLKRVAKRLKIKRMSIDKYLTAGRYHSSTHIRRFGSWSNALKRAGIEQGRREYNVSAEDLLNNLWQLWVALGHQPRMCDLFPPLSRYGRKPYLRIFGRYTTALEHFETWMSKKGKKSPYRSISVKNAGEPIAAAHTTNRDVSIKLRHRVMQRDRFRCRACGASPATDLNVVLHVDHVKPWAKGGETIIDNLQTLCADCNFGKGDL